MIPASIRIFKIIAVDSNFSARKNCEARTYEYLVPSYVFTPPPEATMYCFAPLNEPDDDFIIDNEPAGGLFNTHARQSLSRRKTLKKALKQHPEVVLERKPTAPKISEPMPVEKKNFWQKIMEKLFGKKSNGSDQLKAVLNDTLRRTDSGRVVEEETFAVTLKRTMSKKGSDVIKRDIEEQEQFLKGVKAFEPLDIPEPSEKLIQHLQAYRMPEKQFINLKKTLAMFNGTHNWHNYIPNATQDDPRNFMRIINVDMAEPELHNGLEWIRVKMQVHNVAKYQIRRMMAMLIQVVRTNTPRSVVANSFSINQIDIPEAPGFTLILDEPHYNSYNADALQTKQFTTVNFGSTNADVEKFRDTEIFASIFDYELQNMEFEQWIRQIDNYSFLYTQYLNQNGVIQKTRNVVKEQQ
ncbi:pseudouridine synthase [Gorgonomyces haynaldii]|nr:pseudouridine synthase [Gorgonomyces haynaldii]